MTPEEKAKELIDKFKEYCFHNFDNDAEEQRINNAKECALITTEYLMKQLDNIGQSIIHAERNFRMNYWEQVRNELKKI